MMIIIIQSILKIEFQTLNLRVNQKFIYLLRFKYLVFSIFNAFKSDYLTNLIKINS